MKKFNEYVENKMDEAILPPPPRRPTRQQLPPPSQVSGGVPRNPDFSDNVNTENRIKTLEVAVSSLKNEIVKLQNWMRELGRNTQ